MSFLINGGEQQQKFKIFEIDIEDLTSHVSHFYHGFEVVHGHASRLGLVELSRSFCTSLRHRLLDDSRDFFSCLAQHLIHILRHGVRFS